MPKKHSEKFVAIVDDALTRVPEISTEEVAQKLVRKESFKVIDVREADEYDNGHLPKAIHLSKGVIERDIEEKIDGYDQELVLYCGGGYRSALASDNLQKMGYTNVKSMAGGWGEWNEKSFPTEK